MIRLAYPLPAMCLLMFVGAAQAQTPEAFYAGRTMRMIIGTAPGGGYDLYGRFLASHIGKHIPGRPNIVPVNMPGATSIVAANYLANSGTREGTEILTVAQTLPLAQATHNDRVHFDLAAFNWIGNMVSAPNVFVAWRDAPVKTLDDAFRRELVVGAATPTAIGYLYPAILNKTLGTKFRIVLGYANGEAADLAMERGEVGGRAGASWATLKSSRAGRLRNHEISVFLQVGLKKEPELDDIPLLIDLARNDSERRVFQFYSALTALAHAFAVAPGTPPDRVAALRQAFDDTMRDPDFLGEAARINLEIDPMNGPDVQAAVTQMARTDASSLMLDDASREIDDEKASHRN